MSGLVHGGAGMRTGARRDRSAAARSIQRRLRIGYDPNAGVPPCHLADGAAHDRAAADVRVSQCVQEFGSGTDHWLAGADRAKPADW